MNSTLETPAVTIPFKVRMEPYLVESICEIARLVRDKGAPNSDVSGLLFGKAEPGIRSLTALKTFVDVGAHSELARRQRWEKAYKAAAEEAKSDLELSQLEIVGWFSFRPGSGLLSGDVIFHNQHFKKSEDIALIVWREGPSQITAEVYSKSDSDRLTSDDYRWGSVRLSADIRHMRESVELAMRMKLNEDSYLNTYDDESPPSHFDSLKRGAEAISDKLFGFLNRGKEEAYDKKIRGLIGDGRLPDRTRPSIDAVEPMANPQAYFNPYSDAVVGRTRPVFESSLRPEATDPGSSGPTKAPEPATPSFTGPAHKIPAFTPPSFATPLSPTPAPPPAWPSSGSSFGTAPARIPEYRSDFRFSDASTPLTLPPPSSFGPQIDAAPNPGLNPGLNPGMDLALIGRAPRSGRAPSNEISGLPVPLRLPAPPPKSSHWPLAIGLFLVCSSLVFGFLALGGLQGENGRLGQIIQSVFPGTGLNLRVRNEDDRLRLSWNERNRAVASASDATLQIFDGQLSREIHLDGRQVADGSVLYRPLTNDITFRLEVRGGEGSTSGSVRVLDGLSGRQTTLDVSSPTPNTGVRSLADAQPAGTTSPTLLPDSRNPVLNGSQAPIDPTTAPAPATTATGSPLAAYAPITEGPESRLPARSPALPKPPLSHYETPETIGTIPRAATGQSNSGETINGWDAVPSARAKPKGTLGLSGFVAPRPIQQVMPDVRSIPVGTLPVRTRVSVKVYIDTLGHVTNARVTSLGVNPKAAAASLAAARGWIFDPAKRDGRYVYSEHTIVFVLPVH